MVSHRTASSGSNCQVACRERMLASAAAAA
jgi:hypothetical protein